MKGILRDVGPSGEPPAIAGAAGAMLPISANGQAVQQRNSCDGSVAVFSFLFNVPDVVGPGQKKMAATQNFHIGRGSRRGGKLASPFAVASTPTDKVIS